MNKENMTRTHTGMLFNNIKEGIFAICNMMDGP